MAIYKSKIVCVNKILTYALTVSIVDGGKALKFNDYLKGQVNGILGGFNKEILDGILAKTDGVGAEGFTIIPKYLTDKVTITVHSKCGKSARVIAEDLDWWMFPRLQSVLAENGCELARA